ncbi:sugar transferase [Roseburia sp. MSJ-14]|uniref:sugar transferase n=1 Tax=Roseburia sp. MSJ-14 TaxID=2841514 RepID=UPI001C102C6D|nr:sugar transferase [Roseburia sp. MSJ-14]MBU5474261.1 sugar transferase [Roseburia sp. MSJ-14]
MYKKQKTGWVKHLDFLIIDLICLEMAFLASFGIKFGDRALVSSIVKEYYVRLAIVLLLMDLCIVFLLEAYTGILRRNKVQELRAVIVHCSIVFAAVTVYLWGTKQSEIYSRQVIMVFWGLAIFFEYFARCAWKIYIRQKMIRGKRFSQLIVITEDRYATECVREFQRDRYKEFEVAGIIIVDKERIGEEIYGVPVVADADTCLEYVRANVVDEVFINGNTRESSEALANELLELGVTVHFSLVHESQLMPNKMVERCGRYMVLTSSMKIASTRQLFVKRAIDIIGSLIGLLFTGIAFIIFAPIIKIQSPGPIFYSQIRIGKNGRRFKFYKFRTMVVGADAMKKDLMEQNEMEGLMFKMENDPRIFGIGRFMRKYSIDELPQFWNVLKGEMSLVGTRPPTEEEFEQYELHHKARLGIKPGLTGMWQVSGRSDIKNFEEIVALDTQYISNWSLGVDIRILFRTVLVVLTGKGSV